MPPFYIATRCLQLLRSKERSAIEELKEIKPNGLCLQIMAGLNQADLAFARFIYK